MPITAMLNGRYLTLTEQPNGLKITLTDQGREEIGDWTGRWPDYQMFADLFDDFSSNGWDMLTAEEVGGLTGCQLIISPDAEFADDGDLKDAGTVYWHERYAVEDAIEQLLAGELFLLKA